MSTSTRSHLRVAGIRAVGLSALLAVFGFTVGARAQTVNSGSDGSDGALTLAANLGTIVFDPADAARWTKVLDPDGDGVYNFTTITIGSGTVLKLSADKVARPVYWLASGPVNIQGVVDLSGSAGTFSSANDLGSRRLVAVPGSGGFSGGAGSTVATCAATPPTPGDGPGGGPAGTPCTSVRHANGATFFGNRYLLPMVGGSGGGGSTDTAFGGGGAGGGALLIASSNSIAIAGAINALGGSGVVSSACSGAGGGGSIRLVAPTISGSGNLRVDGGGGCGGTPSVQGAPGQVRLESFSSTSSLGISPSATFVTRGSPVDESTLRPSGQVRVLTIAGIAVPPSPAGSFSLPDVTITAGISVPVEIEATGIPPGTVVTLRVYPQTPSDTSIVYLPAVTASLAGTLVKSNATIDFSFPYGFSRGTIIASWVQ